MSKGISVTSRPGGSGHIAPAAAVMKKICRVAALLLLSLWPPLSAWTAGNPLQETARFTPQVMESMLDADFWISRTPDPDAVLLSPDGIGRFNRFLAAEFGLKLSAESCGGSSILKKNKPCRFYSPTPRQAAENELVGGFTQEIEHHPELSAEQVRSLIEAYSLPYGKGRLTGLREPAPDRAYDRLREEMNLAALPERVKPLWGVTLRRTAIRSFPTAERSLAASDQYGFDLFQETEADLWTPLVILHRSKNGLWAFVRIYHYDGWMKIDNIAVANDKEALFSLLSQREFLVATGSWVESQIAGDGSPRVRFMMGTRIPLVPREQIPRHLGGQNPQANFVVWVPGRNERGFFSPIMAYISTQADVHPGHLPYTRRNLLRQAFKMVGERYSWGGSFEGRDCSRLLVDVYRTVGIMLPRNASQQAKVGVDRFGNDAGDRFTRLKPGTALYMPGHAMMFIGNYDGKSYILHSTAGFRNIPGEAVRPVLAVVVSDMSVLADGIRTIKAAREFVLPDDDSGNNTSQTRTHSGEIRNPE